MPSAVYYMNGPTFASSTAIFMDADLTTLAGDGFYSDNGVYREQVSGVLQPATACPICEEECGFVIDVKRAETGIYTFLVGLDTALGVILINFKTGFTPKGIMVEYDGTKYTSVVSDVYGFIAGATDEVSYYGDEDSPCPLETSPFVLSNFKYLNGDFVPNGPATVTAITSGQNKTTADEPGNLLMVIPKPNASPSTMTVTIVAPCVDMDFELSLPCPTMLVSHSAGAVEATQIAACATLIGANTYYIAFNDGVYGQYSQVFSDDLGENPVTVAGFYKIIGSIYSFNWYELDANGVILQVGSC